MEKEEGGGGVLAFGISFVPHWFFGQKKKEERVRRIAVERRHLQLFSRLAGEKRGGRRKGETVVGIDGVRH